MNPIGNGAKRQRGAIINNQIQVKVPYGWHYYNISPDESQDSWLIGSDKERGTLVLSVIPLKLFSGDGEFVNPWTKRKETLTYSQEGRYETSVFEGAGLKGKKWTYKTKTHFVSFLYMYKKHIFYKEMGAVIEIVNSMQELPSATTALYNIN